MTRVLGVELGSAHRELVQAGRDQHDTGAHEEQTGGSQRAGPSKFEGPDLLAVGVVHIGERDRQRDPQVTVRIDRGSANCGQDQRKLGSAGCLTAWPDRGQGADDVVEFGAFDVALARTFQLGETQQLEFRAEAYNLTNSFRPVNPEDNIRSRNFGRIRRALDPRILQFALKYAF